MHEKDLEYKKPKNIHNIHNPFDTQKVFQQNFGQNLLTISKTRHVNYISKVSYVD